MKFEILIRKVVRKIGFYLVHISKDRPTGIRKRILSNWHSKEGDKTLRLDYDLNPKSIVFDLGGYEGQWASDIYVKYRPKIFIFEPSKRFCNSISRKFHPNADIQVFCFGLSSENSLQKLYLQNDGSSLHAKKKGDFELIELREAVAFLKDNNLLKIDLMKINIEGAEYDLLEHLISNDCVKDIINIQVQFHDFIDSAKVRMQAIQEALSKTHKPTYQFEFIWENWRLKQ